jgi:hypothetical protein
MLLELRSGGTHGKTIRQIARNLEMCEGYFSFLFSPKNRTASRGEGRRGLRSCLTHRPSFALDPTTSFALDPTTSSALDPKTSIALDRSACRGSRWNTCSVGVGANDLFSRACAQGPPGRSVDRVFDKLHRAVAEGYVDPSGMITGCRDRSADAAPRRV